MSTVRPEFRYYVDRSGRQHFNFAQRVWLRRSIPMACTRVHSVALATLAVNLLTMVLEERDPPGAAAITRRRAMRLARRFAAECLLTAPEERWAMPRDASQRGSARKRGAAQVRQSAQNPSLPG